MIRHATQRCSSINIKVWINGIFPIFLSRIASGFPCVVYKIELEIREMSTGGVLRLVFKCVLSFHRQKGGEIGARQDVAKSTG